MWVKCVPVTFGGSTKKGSRYSDFKDRIKDELKKHKVSMLQYDNISIVIELRILRRRVGKNRNDLDNFLKPIIDALDNELLNEFKINSISIQRVLVEEGEEGVDIKWNESPLSVKQLNNG